MSTDNTVFYEELSKRIKQHREYSAYLKLLSKFAMTLPEVQQNELREKVANIADILAREIEQIRALNLENATKH